MKFIFPFLGKTREKYLDEGIQDYAGRLSRFVRVEMPVLKSKPSKNIPAVVFKKQEAAQIFEIIKQPCLVVALDTKGKKLDSPGLAQLIEGFENTGRHTVYFLIGGHMGLDEEVVKKADLVLSLSQLTYTHEMSRLILLEQLYRAFTIKTGQKYHN